MEEGPLRIDLRKILNDRLGSRSRWVPAFVLHALERLVRQKELNRLLEVGFPSTGSEFSRKVLEELGINVEVEGLDELPDGEVFEFVSNHPLGGLDGIALVSVLGARYGDRHLKVLVNDMLMHVEPLKDVFLAVNKYGSQGREAAAKINAAFASDSQIVMFPAGLVSRRQADGSICDLKWQKACVVKALESGRRVVPVRFVGLNSRRFYNMAYWRKKLGIKVNLEQVMLPGELCRASGARYRILFGAPVDIRSLRDSGMSPAEIAEHLKRTVYGLGM